MKRTTRYGLIILGLFVFLIAAPLILLYVSGLKIDVNGKQTLETGLLSIDTEPKDAQIFLNAKQTATSPSHIRFLNPGDYDVLLKKQGYRDWSKRLPLLPGKVTWINIGVEKVFLFANQTPPTTLDTSVTDAYLKDNTEIFYVTQSSLVGAFGSSFDEKESFSLPKDTYTITHSTNERYLVLKGVKNCFTFDTNNKTLLNFSSLVSQGSNFTVVDNGSLVFIKNKKIGVVRSPEDTPSYFGSDILALSGLENNIYALEKTENASTLSIADINQARPALETLVANLQNFTAPQLWASKTKALFIFDQGTLYHVGIQATVVANNINEVEIDTDTGIAAFTTPGAIYVNYPEDEHATLISRSVEGFSKPLVRPDMGYVFIASGKKIKAIELDTRDRSNIYEFGEGDTIAQIMVAKNTKTLWAITNGTLWFEKIH